LENKKEIAVVYSHHKLGDLLWQLPYIKAISDHFKTQITLVVRPKTQATNILKDIDYIKNFFYCQFRKKIWYFVEIFYLYNFFKKKNFSHVFLLDKISRPAIAAKLAGVKNVVGQGLGGQKKWLTNKNFLDHEDYLNLDYSDQSKKFLEINGISVNDLVPTLYLKPESLDSIEPKINKEKKILSFGVDSFEEYKMWFEDQFAELADLFFESKLADEIFLIASKNNHEVVKKIIDNSKYSNFYNCSQLDLLGVIKAISNSKFYVGNNSGPLNLASALNIKCFGLIANDKVSELKNSRIIPILPDNYENKFYRNRDGMRRLDVKKVFDFIYKELT
jgi:heptosyltransferase-2